MTDEPTAEQRPAEQDSTAPNLDDALRVLPWALSGVIALYGVRLLTWFSDRARKRGK